MDQLLRRLLLQELLEATLGSEYVYFQPPENTKMVYPCIVYQLDDAATKFADNIPYHIVKSYQVTVIDRDPDSLIPDEVAKLPSCTFSRSFPAEKLNHFVYNLFF